MVIHPLACGHCCRAMGEAFISNLHCWVKLQCIKVISLAGITFDSEKEMLVLTTYLKKYLKKSNTLGKYLNTNTFNS